MTKIQRYTFEKVGEGYQFTTTTDGLWVMAKDVEQLEQELAREKEIRGILERQLVLVRHAVE